MTTCETSNPDPPPPTGDKIAEVTVDGRALELFLPDSGADKLYVCDIRRKYQPVGAVVRLATTSPVYVAVTGQGEWAEHSDRADRIVQLAVACYWNCTDHGTVREARPKGRAGQWRARFTPHRTGKGD